MNRNRINYNTSTSSRLARLGWFHFLFVMGAVAWFTLYGKAQINSANAPAALAVLDGNPILEDQLPADLQAQLTRMMQQVYLVKLRGLHQVVDRQLLDKEANRRGITTEALISAEMSKVPEPSDDEVKTYYDTHTEAIHQPVGEAKSAIRQNLKVLAVQNAGRVYTQTLLQDAVNNGELAILLKPPKINAFVDPERAKGEAHAPVTIVEFSDFSCTFCRRAESTLDQLMEKYPGKLRLGYRDFPLTQLHPQAELAAEASRCAAEQGRYWPYHDVLFAHQGRLDHDDLIAYAHDLTLDQPRFTQCLNTARYSQQVHQDIDLGMRDGVVATPGFFVNGTFVDGAQPATVFEQIINHELAATQKQSMTRAGVTTGTK